MRTRRAFTAVELLVCLGLVAALVLLAGPLTSHARRDPGLAVSLNNMHLIMAATAQYELDTGRVPMRGTKYTGGMINGGWDTWNFGGKNCGKQGWGIFDEPAYVRMLNAYLYPDVQVPVPMGYLNVGSGPTWSFDPGVPTIQQRPTVHLPVYQSPGDVSTYMGRPGTGWAFGWANPNESGYQDVGTSYHLNMAWWNHPSLTGSFTQKYNTGSNLISLVAPANYVFLSDQVGMLAPLGWTIPGEFGGTNMSVVGFMDGRAEYIEILKSTLSGPGYTLWPGGRSVGSGVKSERRR